MSGFTEYDVERAAANGREEGYKRFEKERDALKARLDGAVKSRNDILAERDALKAELAQLKARIPREPFDVRCADALADEVAVLIKSGRLDTRSPAGDALLDYRNPPMTTRADALVNARVTAERLAARVEQLKGALSEIRCYATVGVTRGPESDHWIRATGLADAALAAPDDAQLATRDARVAAEATGSLIQHCAMLDDALRALVACGMPARARELELHPHRQEAVVAKIDHALAAAPDDVRAYVEGIRAEALREAADHFETARLEALDVHGGVVEVDAKLGPQIAAKLRALATTSPTENER